MDLVEFLRARMDEDARLANRTEADRRWVAVTNAPYGPQVRVGDGPDIGETEPEWQRGTNVQVWQCEDELDGCPDMARGWIAEAEHIARHDPARVLAEVEAKREIVGLHEPVPEYEGGPLVCKTCMISDDYLHGPTYEQAPCPTLCALGLAYAQHADYLKVRP